MSAKYSLAEIVAKSVEGTKGNEKIEMRRKTGDMRHKI